ncbi:Thioredoxin [hydrothermal vent metagenome]|uniref:Thioredoxin n=1 Tax=hydrothermal vent metagenome TaxID=652676 RepID=A0A1W1BAZ2_9ZZZZ
MTTLQRSIFFTILLMITTVYSSGSDTKYSLTTTDGKDIHINGTKDAFIFDEYRGKVIFLEMFGHRCRPCLKMVDRYKKLKDKYKDKIAIVAIEVQGLNDAQLKSFTEKKGINYTTISSEKADSFIEYIRSRTDWKQLIPFLIILDKKGKPQFTHVGVLPDKFLDNATKELLSK